MCRPEKSAGHALVSVREHTFFLIFLFLFLSRKKEKPVRLEGNKSNKKGLC